MIDDPFPHQSCSWEDPYDWDALDPNVVPDQPGFYAFTDHSDTLETTQAGKAVLYVGIATISLRGRLKSYKTGDSTGIANMHKGGFLLMVSRAGAVHSGDAGRIQHSVQRKPIDVITLSGSGPAQHSVLEPEKIYIRWAIDPRAAIEALLIRGLRPKYNTMHQPG